MALNPKQLAELLKMRALGFSQAEIAERHELMKRVQLARGKDTTCGMLSNG